MPLNSALEADSDTDTGDTGDTGLDADSDTPEEPVDDPNFDDDPVIPSTPRQPTATGLSGEMGGLSCATAGRAEYAWMLALIPGVLMRRRRRELRV